MELRKKNIHMDRIKCKASMQTTLEDDRNVPDQKPDMERILLKRGTVKAEEIKPSENHVSMKGRLEFTLLYAAKDGSVSTMTGQLPIEEQIYLEGAENGDRVELKMGLEDLSIDMINSRKLSVRALLSLEAFVQELYDEEVAVELYQEEPVELKQTLLPVTELTMLKKDILRLKETVELPQSFPNIFEILWEEAVLTNVSFEAGPDQLKVQGELSVFFLYEGEGEEHPLKCYEKIIPIRESIECQGCKEGMIPNIAYQISQQEMEVRADFDGEERVVSLELLLDLEIKLYEEQQIKALTDVYGISGKVQAMMQRGSFDRLLRAGGRTKLTGQFKLPAGAPGIGEIKHSSAEVGIDSMELAENGVELNGSVEVWVLYVDADATGLFTLRESLPFVYVLEAEGISQACRYDVAPSLEQLTTAATGGGEVEIRAVLSFGLFGMCTIQEDTIADLTMEKHDTNVTKELPGIVVYAARGGEELWELGKQYYVPLSQIREMNHLTSDVLKAGEKLLIVR